MQWYDIVAIAIYAILGMLCYALLELDSWAKNLPSRWPGCWETAEQSIFLPFSQKSKMADMFFSNGIIYLGSILSVSGSRASDRHRHTHTQTHRIAYYCPAWAVAWAGENYEKNDYIIYWCSLNIDWTN